MSAVGLVIGEIRRKATLKNVADSKIRTKPQYTQYAGFR